MEKQQLKSNALLLLTAAIWGFAFVAQRVGGKFVGSFTFNGVRFALGSLSLVPLILYFNKKSVEKREKPKASVLLCGIIAGGVLFLGATLQQVGLIETSAGKAAFITGLYIVFVPIFSVFLKQHIQVNTWIGVSISIIGLYFLSVTDGFGIARGDLFECAGAIAWAVHILLIDNFTKKVDALKLSSIQFATCSVLSLISAFIFETITINGLVQAIVPILYGGICSVGVAYTLQVVAQKNAKPSHAAIILSMEAVFASIGGLLILHENLGVRGYFGCALMLTGMLLSQLSNLGKR